MGASDWIQDRTKFSGPPVREVRFNLAARAFAESNPLFNETEFNTKSGFRGASYGSETPVKFGIFPSLAFL